MRIDFLSLCVTAVAVLSFSLAGCDSGSKGTPSDKAGGDGASASETDHHEGDGHDHGKDDGHDHGDEADDGHATEGPHGGHLIELGNEEYHAELLHDENTHTVTIHLLDGPGKQAVAVPLAELTLQLLKDGKFVKYALKSVPGSGDAAGTASRFEIVDAELCDALGHEGATRGRLQVTINGKPYTGSIEHESHGDHEGHKH